MNWLLTCELVILNSGKFASFGVCDLRQWRAKVAAGVLWLWSSSCGSVGKSATFGVLE